MLSSVPYEDKSAHIYICIHFKNKDIHTTYITQTYIMHTSNAHTQMIKNAAATIKSLPFGEAHYTCLTALNST